MKNTYNSQEIELISYIYRRKSYYRYIFILFIIGIIIFLFKYKFYTYQKLTLIKDIDNYIVISDITKENIILDNKYLYINSNKYRYKVLNISNEYNSYNDIPVENITISIPKLKNKTKTLNTSLLIGKKTLIDMAVEVIKGG